MRVIKVEAKSPFLISDNEKVYRVINGEVDLFLTKIKSGKAEGRRFFLGTLKKNDLISGAKFDSDLKGYGLLVSGLYGTEIEETKDIDADSVVKMFTAISSNFAKSASDIQVFKSNFEAPKGTLFKIKSGGLLKIERGKALFFNNKIPNNFIMPSTFVLADSDLKATVSNDENEIISSMDSSMAIYLRGFLYLEQYKERVNATKFKEKLQQGKNYISSSLRRLMSVFESSVSQSARSEEPHLAVAELIGDYLDMRIVRPRINDPTYQSDPLGEIARVSKFMTRAVTLDDGWHKQDSGPIFGFIGESPVAIIPKGSGYKVINPKTGENRVVTKSIADQINRLAYVIYKPFPNKALNLWDIFSFVMRPNTIRDFVSISLMGAMMGILGMFTPIVTGIIFSSVIPAAEYNSLFYIILFLISITITSSIFGITRSIASLRFEGRVDYMIQSAIWARLLSLPVPFFSKYDSSDLSARANSIITIRRMLTGAAMSTILSAIFSVFQFFLLFYYSLSLALIGIVLTIIPIAVVFLTGKFRLTLVKKAMSLNTKSSSTIMQIIKGISKFKIIGGERRAFSLWADKYNEQNTVQEKASSIARYTGSFNQIYPVITSVVIFYFISKSPDISVGTYLAFQSAFSSFMGSLLGLASTAVSLLNVIPLYDRARPILEAIPEVTEQKRDPGRLKGAISVSNVSYKYKDDSPEVLRGVNIDIKPGEFVAFVGESGSGKSTLMRLLLAFDKPQDGTIRYDNYDLNDLDVQAARRAMGVVLQEGRLMPGDIFNNIIGPYNLTMDDAWAAAEAAGFAEDIRDMPMGMHTVVGGGTLSGGQKQRVLIARALVNKPKIIFFDAATSALDNKTQSIVMDSLKKSDATKIIIAHRLTTIMNADKIFVFDVV